jgi:CoA:oxalate CoA-transferase
MQIAGSPLHLSETPGRVYRGAPALGENSEEILGSVLKKTRAEIESLKAEGVINK